METWQEKKPGKEWAKSGPLLRGEHRPRIMRVEGVYFANGKAGYIRRFADLAAARAWVDRERGE